MAENGKESRGNNENNQNNLIFNFTKLIGFEREMFLKHGRVEAYQ